MDSLARESRTRNKNAIIQTDTIDHSEFEKLKILTGGTDIKVYVHDKRHIDLLLETYDDGPQLWVNRDEDTAVIEATGDNSAWFSVFRPPVCLHVSVPLDIADSWHVKTGSGDVTIPKVRSNIFQVTLGSGDLDLTDLKAKEAKLHTSSGDISVRDVAVDTLHCGTTSGDAGFTKVKAGYISGASTSGELNFKNVYSEKFITKVTSGDAYINDVRVHEAHLACTSGDVKAKDMEANSASLKSSSGDIHCSFINDCNIQGNATSGDITIVCKNKQPNAKIDVQTSSGRIDTNLSKRLYQRSRKHLTGVAGNGEHRIQLKTSSGDVGLLYR